MFSKNHHNILKEIDSGSADSRVLADKIGLPAALIRHLMEELVQYDFIKVTRAYREGVREIAGAYLDTKGKAAVESPDYFLEKPMATDQGNNWYGDRVAGDKFTGDKVMGNKVQIDTVQGDAVAGNKIVNANTAELLQLIATMRQTAATFPQAIQDDLIIDIDDVEAEINKPEAERNPTKLKKRLMAILATAGVIASSVAGATDFASKAIDVGSKLGIELHLPPSP
jgi:hypothetical protein